MNYVLLPLRRRREMRKDFLTLALRSSNSKSMTIRDLPSACPAW